MSLFPIKFQIEKVWWRQRWWVIGDHLRRCRREWWWSGRRRMDLLYRFLLRSVPLSPSPLFGVTIDQIGGQSLAFLWVCSAPNSDFVLLHYPFPRPFRDLHPKPPNFPTKWMGKWIINNGLGKQRESTTGWESGQRSRAFVTSWHYGHWSI